MFPVTIEHLEAGYIPHWLLYRISELTDRATQQKAELETGKTLCLIGTIASGFLINSNPLAPFALVSGFGGYAWSLIVDMVQTGKFSPLPWVRDGFLDFVSSMGDRTERELYMANMDSVEQLSTYLNPVEQQEFRLLRCYLEELAHYLLQVPIGSRYTAYLWIVQRFIISGGQLPTSPEISHFVSRTNVHPYINRTVVQRLAAQVPEMHSTDVQPYPDFYGNQQQALPPTQAPVFNPPTRSAEPAYPDPWASEQVANVPQYQNMQETQLQAPQTPVQRAPGMFVQQTPTEVVEDLTEADGGQGAKGFLGNMVQKLQSASNGWLNPQGAQDKEFRNVDDLMEAIRRDCPILLHLINCRPVRIYGAQRSGKTSFAICLLYLRALIAGHQITAVTPNFEKEPASRYPQWCNIIGHNAAGQPDYQAIAVAWGKYAANISNVDGNQTVIWDEFGAYGTIIPSDSLQSVLKLSLMQSEKYNKYPVYIVHGETKAFLPGLEGMIDNFKASTIRVEVIAQETTDKYGCINYRPSNQFTVTPYGSSKTTRYTKPVWFNRETLERLYQATLSPAL